MKTKNSASKSSLNFITHTQPRVAIMATMILAGCSTINNSGDPELSIFGGGGDRVNSAGAHQIIDESFERVDLISILDPTNSGSLGYAKCSASSSDKKDGCMFDVALTAYHNDKGYDTVATRNNIQDRLISASEQRCNVYLTYVQRHYSSSNFNLGALTTILGGAGAIATNVTAARSLSGLGGIFSGIRAEYNQSYLYSQTVNVISQGIHKKRQGILTEIDSHRKNSPTDYTVERAISDALRYHGACSLVAGLEEVNVAINLSRGLEALKTDTETVGTISENIKKIGAKKSGK